MSIEVPNFDEVLAWLLDIGEPPNPGSLIREEEYLPELVIAFARPQGTDNEGVVTEVQKHLSQHRYFYQSVSITDLLQVAATLVSRVATPENPFNPDLVGYPATLQLMRWGDIFRKSMTPWEMARFATAVISFDRARVQAAAKEAGCHGVAYLVRNLMHSAEVNFFRTVYKQRFFLVATHQPEQTRRQRLVDDLRRHDLNGDPESEADLLIRIDMGERPAEINDAFRWDIGAPSNSLNMNDTFHRGDVFVGFNNFEHTVRRWMEQVFDFPWGTPTLPELGMSIAYDAARMSGSFGRPVGAAIVDGDSVVGLGWNDSPKMGGGVSRVDVVPNFQDHFMRPPVDPSDENRIATVKDLLSRLFAPEWDFLYDEPNLTPDQENLRDWLKPMRSAAKDSGQKITDEMIAAMASLTPISSSRVFSLIEYGHTVHAEMAAITDAARRGASIQDATLYVTTFPCHECARNIVASGISRVIFVEPYSKSLTDTLYAHLILNTAKEAPSSDGRVVFEPFVGVSPSRFQELFSPVTRKHGISDALLAKEAGKRVGEEVGWSPFASNLRIPIRGYFSAPDFEQYDLFERSRRLAEEAVCGSLANDLRQVFPQLITAMRAAHEGTVADSDTK